MNRELESKINVEQFIDWLNKTFIAHKIECK